MTEPEDDVDEEAELSEFASEVAEAIEQCLDVDDVRVRPSGLIIVTTADGAKYRVRIQEDE